MLRRVCAPLQPHLSRCISGVSPTIFLRPQQAVAKADPLDGALLRSKLSALVRFSKAQLPNVADAGAKAQLQADIAKYEKYMDNTDAFVADVKGDVQAQVDMLLKLDRYPEVPIGRLNDLAEALEKKMKTAFAVLEQQPKQDLTVDPEYWATSKFRVLNIQEGTVACMPEGDVPPGAIELLVGQIIETKIDGEDVYIEVERVDEGKMMLWFKPDVALPKNAEVMWSYPYEPLAKKTGAKWLTQENVVVASKPGEVVVAEDAEPGEWAVEIVKAEAEPEPAKFPGPTPAVDLFKPLAEKIQKSTSADTAAAFKKAILEYGDHLDLEAEYASHYDREVVEAKRDRYIAALVAAQSAPLPVVNPISLAVNVAVYKGTLVDQLRRVEARIADYQLQARLHERKLQGEAITPEEELEYTPHIRDDAELERDYNDPFFGRYIWQLFPHTEGDADCLIQDVRFRDMPQPTNTLAVMLQNYEKGLPQHKKAERAITAGIYAALALQQKEADRAAGKIWPGVDA